MKLYKFLAMSALLLVPAASVTAADGYVRMSSGGVAVGVSPSGDKVFGYNGRSGDDSQSSWIFDVNDLSTTQFTNFTEYDLDAGGQVMWINSAGTAVGTLLDEQWCAPQISDGNDGVLENYPLFSACIWRDGELIKLDHNRWADPAEFVGQDGTLPSIGNGFAAKQISDDESTIAGYLRAFTYYLPVKWTRNADGEYESTMLERPIGVFFYMWVGASADCNRVIMNTSQSGGESYIWDGDNSPLIFSYTEPGCEIVEPVLTALSPNGRYAIMRCERDGNVAHGVFDFETFSVDWIPLPEGARSSNWFAATVVTDRGDGFICDYNYQLHYFNIELGINIPFKSYLEAYGSDISYECAVPAKALARMVSADGRTICGNILQNSLEDRGWVVRLPDTQPMLFALSNCEAMYCGTSTVLLKWDEPFLPVGADIDYYMVKVDDGEAARVEATLGDDYKMRAEVSCPAGEHAITIYAVAHDKDGKEWESVHQTLNVEISAETSLFFFENLDDCTIDETVMAYIYNHDTFVPVDATDSRALSFRPDAGDFYNLSPFWYSCGFATSRWDTYIESRWFDASDYDEDFYFTWHERNLPINTATEYVADNRLLVEYTTDGEHWQLLHESNGADNGGKWNVRVADLSHLCGTSFRLRFHVIGGGTQACEWRIDYYGILPATEMYEAPEGLMAVEEGEGNVKLAWKNNRGEYEVSYNFNSPMTYNNNVGNAGEPFYVGCLYGPSKIASYEGKYITAVSTMLYEPSYIQQEEHTKVQAVVFDTDGNELARGTLSPDAPWYMDDDPIPMMPIHHIDLDQPVLIEKGKSYIVSILITDYMPQMCPIWYFSASDDYIPGVTDLYSDDNLQSWNSLSRYWDQNAQSEEEYNLYGRCIFNVRPCITDEPFASSTEYAQTQWFYQVYRDGKLLPHGIAYYTQQSAVDNAGGEAAYTVQSYRRDGAVSLMSQPLYFVPSGIDRIAADGDMSIDIVATDCGFLVVGDYDSVEIYNVAGVKVAQSRFLDTRSLQRGVYIVTAVKDGRTASRKIVF